MLNWWLILLIILIPLLCIALTVYVIFYFQSEEDSGVGDLLPKIVFGLALILALGSVLLVPYDVGNSPDPTVPNRYAYTLNTQLMWQIVLWIMAVMAVIVCPFFLFFYEARDPDKPRVGKQVANAVLSTLVIVIVFVVITAVCYARVGVSLIPYAAYATTARRSLVDNATVFQNATYTNETLTIDVTFTTYCIGMLCFFGWIFFVIYGGIGIVAYPLRLLYNFTHRTKAIGAARFNEEMAVVLAKADALLEMALKLQKETRARIAQATRTHIGVLRNEVYLLEAQQAQLIWAYTKAGGSPFIVYGKVVLAIICLGTAIAWCIHIFVYNTFHADPFLNTLLIRLGNAFALFGIIAYGVLAFYLMWATFQGQIALGLRLIFFQIHPMQKHDTLVNAFLFNASLLLITSYAVIQFVVRSFQDYAPYTAINGLMNVYVLHLKGIGAIIRWIQFAFLGMTLLGLVWIGLCPRKRHKYDPTHMRLDDLR